MSFVLTHSYAQRTNRNYKRVYWRNCAKARGQKHAQYLQTASTTDRESEARHIFRNQLKIMHWLAAQTTTKAMYNYQPCMFYHKTIRNWKISFAVLMKIIAKSVQISRKPEERAMICATIWISSVRCTRIKKTPILPSICKDIRFLQRNWIRHCYPATLLWTTCWVSTYSMPGRKTFW